MSGFVDAAQLHAKGGDGGAGCVSFRREAHVAHGGPDGGDGGHGGDVYLVADPNQASLLGFRDHPFRRATNGGHGGPKKMHGARGTDLIVPVPVGTVVRRRDGTPVVDLALNGERWRAAAGGQGGRGNARFLSNERRAPGFAEQGEHGEEVWFDLELKLRADVALIGFPNVGKSTLIARVSAARPKIADYPFTTLVPHLGVVRVGVRASDPTAATEFVMADIPGLIEGAAGGRGLGQAFLRHVEHAAVLCVLIDLAPLAPAPADEQLAVLLAELGAYQPALLERPRLVIGSRADLAPDHATPDTVAFAISAVTGAGVDRLLGELAGLVRDAREAPIAVDDVVVHRPLPETVGVEAVGAHHWRLTGRPAERAARFQDLNDAGAMAEALRRLRSLGVDRLLRRAGAQDGDIVDVGALSLEWYSDPHHVAPDEPQRRTQRERRGRPNPAAEGDDAER